LEQTKKEDQVWEGVIPIKDFLTIKGGFKRFLGKEGTLSRKDYSLELEAWEGALLLTGFNTWVSFGKAKALFQELVGNAQGRGYFHTEGGRGFLSGNQEFYFLWFIFIAPTIWRNLGIWPNPNPIFSFQTFKESL